MKIFLSHSSRHKPLVREIKRHLPEHINPWLDENDLLIGEDISKTLRDVITSDTDFVVVFIDENSIKSEWVKRELEWSLLREKEINRIFILPLVLDRDAWEMLEPVDFRNRKFLLCTDYDEVNVRSVANNLIAQLFAWLSRDIEQRRKKDTSKSNTIKLLDDADKFISDIAEEIRFIVYPHRKRSPLLISNLFKQFQNHSLIGSLSLDQFNDLLIRLQTQGYLSGMVNDTNTIYLDEEHYSWKTELFKDAKVRIANKAMALIKSGDVIALDSGSSTLELAKLISKGLKMRIWDNLKIVTNSIPAANELLNTSSQLGLDDHNSVINVFVTGGRVRPNTLAIVNVWDNISERLHTEFVELLEKLGGADICFVGANGIHIDNGLSTHNNSEVQTKSDILSLSRKKVILADSSKFGIVEERIFCTFEDGITIITDGLRNTELIVEINQKLENSSSQLIIAS